MWQIKYILAENFMSFQKVEYAFDNKCYLVRANNLENSGQESNGGGKTSFVDIPAIGLLGYSLTGRNVKDCVNWYGDEKFLTIKMYMENSAHQMNCLIERKIHASSSKGQELAILVNDTVPKTLPTKKGIVNGVDVRAGNAYILKEILDINEEDLLNYYLISKSNYKPFLEVNTDRKLEVIGRFSRAEVVDGAIEKVEKELVGIEKNINDSNQNIASAQGYIQALEDTLKTDIEADFLKKKEDDIKAIKDKISSVENTIAGLDTKISELEESKKSFNLSDVDEDGKKQLLESKAQFDLEIGNGRSEKESLAEAISMIKNYLAGLITCPKCTHQFHLTEEDNFTEEDLTAMQDEHESVSNLLNANIELYGEVDERLGMIEQQENYNKKIKLELDIIARNIKSIEQQKEREKKQYERFTKDLQETENRAITNERYNIRQQIKAKEREIESIQLQLTQLNADLAEKKKWVDHFYDFKFYLGNKPIENICGLVNQYLKLNGSDLNLFIEGFKKIRSGELRQVLNPVIYRNWLDPHPYVQFSGGEKVRLDISTDLSFQQLINSNSKYGGLDYYQNDMLINELDSLGVKNAAEAFNQLGKTIVLVTHSGADLVYENVVLIEKKNKISAIV